ncbi:hypothetical protein [Bathymodiolus thermophilus thioautotrophic gill symbiont]|uniref:Uncharacterized protein n=1 Tax=Bathymodiolus thermophilus thioautotrophic gill symbiont TaxID=2360 RepID=A0A8H8XB98_9GAMM|nr:hypothetical protein [Bathymodiolus thermophilus thioautotrophic gill symbiont]CAB5496876.1 hypothetical protein THERMOS_579 [Bathymodiolus thermophilus thioautotrophic gill symbiont]
MKNKEIDYFKLVEECASKKMDVKISNGKIEHAQILLQAMLRHGKNSVNMFAGTLNKKLYASLEFRISVKIYHLISNGKLNFIIQDINNLQNHPLYVLVKSIDPRFDKIKFFIVKKDSEASKYKNHFSTMDDLAYRNEIDDEGVSAIANFNDKETNKEFRQKFNIFMEQSVQFIAQ